MTVHSNAPKKLNKSVAGLLILLYWRPIRDYELKFAYQKRALQELIDNGFIIKADHDSGLYEEYLVKPELNDSPEAFNKAVAERYVGYVPNHLNRDEAYHLYELEANYRQELKRYGIAYKEF